MSSGAHTDVFQQTFALSLLAGQGADLQGDTPAILMDQLQRELSAYLVLPATSGLSLMQPDPGFITQMGRWEVAWGVGGVPRQVLGSEAYELVNTMYVGFNPSVVFPNDPTPRPTYIVAIAGTNSASRFDWMAEDADVRHTVEWDTWDPSNTDQDNYFDDDGMATDPPTAVISKSTGLAAGIVLRMTAPPGLPGANLTLQQFLESCPAENATVIIAGHSLGGALAPTVALWLHQAGALARFIHAFVYPTAGPSPGNGAFAARFSAAFPPVGPLAKPYQVWNRDVSNTLDVVPHAWNAGTLNGMKKMYVERPIDLFRHTELNLIIDVALDNASASGGVYEPIQPAYLTGTPYLTDLTGQPLPYPIPDDDDSSLTHYFAQAELQHWYAYQQAHDGAKGLIISDGFPQVTVTLLSGVRKASSAL